MPTTTYPAWKIEVLRDGRSVYSQPIAARSFTIGRGEAADLCIPSAAARLSHLVYRAHGSMWLKSMIDDESAKVIRSGRAIDLSPYTLRFVESQASVDGAVTAQWLERDRESKPTHIQYGDTLHALTGEAITLGTAPSCDLVLDDPTVSSRHLTLRVTEEGLHAEDLGSTNGTWLKGHRVGRAILNEETTLRLGKATIELVRDADTERVACPLLGPSARLEEARNQIAQMAPSNLPVLIRGESGTGKELAAQHLVACSKRKDSPFLSVNCGALQATLLRSELFGHRKGAFTGADRDHRGLFEEADGGTLFLDEVGELPLEMQASLLRVLESGEVQPVGEARRTKVDTRVIAATHRDLASMVRAGEFREDLYHRLCVLEVGLPPLRARPADLDALAQHFVDEFSEGICELKPCALKRLRKHEWPGNVRELRNCIQRTLVMRSKDELDASDIMIGDSPRAGAESQDERVLDLPMDAIEQAALHRHLKNARGNRSLAARTLGISRATMHRRLESLSIDVDALVFT